MTEELRSTGSDDLVTADRRRLETDELLTAAAREEAALEKRAGGNRTLDNQSRNQALVSYWALPFIFLTVALLGGLRVSVDDHSFIFFQPPLITLVLAVLLMLLFVRGGLIELHPWIAGTNPPLANLSHIWLLLTLFFASAQAFNSVLPERGLFHWLFSFFFLWTLWNNQFSSFDARRLLGSLAVLFGTAFVLKHLLLASLYAPDGGWLKRVASALVQGVSLGTLDTPAFASATGYISFVTLGLYIAGLVLMGLNSKQQKVNGKQPEKS